MCVLGTAGRRRPVRTRPDGGEPGAAGDEGSSRPVEEPAERRTAASGRLQHICRRQQTQLGGPPALPYRSRLVRKPHTSPTPGHRLYFRVCKQFIIVLTCNILSLTLRKDLLGISITN